MNHTPIHRPFELPASPIPVHGEIRDASHAIIAAEQTLQDLGCRDCVLRLSSADAQEFQTAYAEFLGWLQRRESRAGLRALWRGLALGAGLAYAVAGAGFVVAKILGV